MKLAHEWAKAGPLSSPLRTGLVGLHRKKNRAAFPTRRGFSYPVPFRTEFEIARALLLSLASFVGETPKPPSCSFSPLTRSRPPRSGPCFLLPNLIQQRGR